MNWKLTILSVAYYAIHVGELNAHRRRNEDHPDNDAGKMTRSDRDAPHDAPAPDRGHGDENDAGLFSRSGAAAHRLAREGRATGSGVYDGGGALPLSRGIAAGWAASGMQSGPR